MKKGGAPLAVALLLLAGGVFMVWAGLTGQSLTQTFGSILTNGTGEPHPGKAKKGK